MREERSTGDLRDSDSSSFKTGLIVAGVICGMSALFFGGLAGYVAWKDSGRPVDVLKNASVNTPSIPPEAAREVLRSIINIDIPPDFEGIEVQSSSPLQKISFGRKVDDGALLKLGKQEMPQGFGEQDQQMAASMLGHMTEMGTGRTDVSGQSILMVSTGTVRELTVLGKKTEFRFAKGNLSSNGKSVWKISGTFASNTGSVALIYTIPEDEYDEAAVVKFIESIRPADGLDENHTDHSANPAEKDEGKAADEDATRDRPVEDAKPEKDDSVPRSEDEAEPDSP